MNQHEQCSLDALLFLLYRVKLDDVSFFFLGEELNLEQFYFFVLSVEWFWKPSSILYWEQEAGSARRSATCDFSWFTLRLLAC